MITDLIYDVGMNDGMDTAHYLAEGFRVVAVEADPALCQEARIRFAEALSSGRLTIESVGIAEESGTATFYVNDTHSEFSAFDPEVAGRNGMKYHPVQVKTSSFRELLSKHGVPYYLKIDIEGADRHCITALSREGLPAYVSIEAHKLEYLLILWNLGYRHFKVVDQTRHNSKWPLLSNESGFSRSAKLAFSLADRIRNKFAQTLRFKPGSSGPFAEATPGSWESIEDVAYTWLHHHRGYHSRGTLSRCGWYDFHAKLE